MTDRKRCEELGRAARNVVDEHIRQIASEDVMVLSLKALGAPPFLMVQAIRDFQAAQRNRRRRLPSGLGKSVIVQRVIQREASAIERQIDREKRRQPEKKWYQFWR